MDNAQAVAHLQQVLKSVGKKLKDSMDSGPMEYGGEAATLTSEEATVLYRVLTEQAGFDFTRL